MTKYLFDSDVFITAHAVHYGMEFCPAFWDWLVQANKDGIVFSIDKIRDELNAKSDGVSKWCGINGDGFFLPVDEAALAKIGEVASWPSTQSRFREAAIKEFLASADMHLIAFALAHGFTIITNEQAAPEGKRSVKIPDVCSALGVSHTTLWRLLRTEKPMMVLRQKDPAGTIDAIKH